MSRRDGVLKGLSAALQPKNLDLTKFARDRVGDTGGRVVTRNMSSEDAAGALGFAAMDWLEDPDDLETKPGDPLVTALIRLKYAEHRRQAFFGRALQLLVDRGIGEYEHRPSGTMNAVAAGALFEWVNDDCPRCRGAKGGAPKVTACPVCKPTTPEHPKFKGEHKPLGRREEIPTTKGYKIAARAGAQNGCPKCRGLGRIFRKPKKGRGMRCIPCGSSGRRTFKPWERWRVVHEILLQPQREDLQRWKRLKAPKPPAPRITGRLSQEAFTKQWLKFYDDFITILRKADKRAHVSIDTQVSRMENADTVPDARRKPQRQSDESYVSVGQNLQAELPPQEP